MEITNYSHSQLVEMGTLTSQDIKRVNQCRRNYNKLGFAYQVIFVKLANYFPKQKPFEIIPEVLTFASLQLNIDGCEIISYKKRRETIAEHQEQIRFYLNLNRFDHQAIELLNTFLFIESCRLEQSGILLVRAEQFLKENRFLQPASDTLKRIIVSQREKARQFIFEKIYSQLDEKMIEVLDSIISVDDGKKSKLQQLKCPPAKASPKGILALIQKLDLIQESKILEIEQSWLNNNYQRSLAKYCSRCSAHRLRQMKPSHRYAILVCFLWQTNRDTIDYIIDMHCKLITKVYNHAQNEIFEEMRKKRKRIRSSLAILKLISNLILDDTVSDEELRKKVFQRIPREILIAQIDEAESWLTGKYSHVFNLVIKRFNYLRQFSPALFNHIHFQPEGNISSDLLEAIDILRDLNSNNKRKLPEDTPIGFVPVKLRNLVAPCGNIDKQAWECALLTRVRDEIKTGNLSVKGSKRFCKFDDFFMSDNDWIKIRSDFFKRIKLPENPTDVPSYLIMRLNNAYDTFLAKESANTYAKVKDNKWILSVDAASELTPEDELDLDNLKSWLTDHMRHVKLPELLIEVDNDLHFTRHFMLPVKQNQRLVEDICSILATIMAHGCFIGPYTMARLTPGISYEQIKRVTDWQLTEEAQRSSLAEIVKAISDLDVTQSWGYGKTSSSDGQRYEFKQKVLHQTYSTKFGDFALEFYTFVADNYAPFYSTPIECTDRDAAYVLDGLLYNESDLAIEEHYTDTHGYTEINFAAFALLGRTFSPRIRGVQHQKIYRIDEKKDYANLKPLLSSVDHSIHIDWITDQWDRMGQFYASLERGHATASTALKRLVSFNSKNHFYRANRELGRIMKTENILLYMSDPLLRKKRQCGLLKGEQMHQLAREVAYGKRGKIKARDFQEQKNTCSCLTLILACIIYWQAREIKRVIEECDPKAEKINLKLLEHISPIGWDNILLYGEYVINKNLIK